jgi:hypothetical protein
MIKQQVPSTLRFYLQVPPSALLESLTESHFTHRIISTFYQLDEVFLKKRLEKYGISQLFYDIMA